jgi:hypothetical protein
MRIKVRAEGIDKYPELLEAYKLSLGAALEERYGAKPDWDTFRIYKYADDPAAPQDQHDFAILTVEGEQ